MPGLSRRAALFLGGTAIGGLGGAWTAGRHLARIPVLDGTASMGADAKGAAATLDDASGLSRTPIHRHVTLQQDAGDALVQALRAEIAEARRDARPLNIGAARHSMGGQAIPPAGQAVTLDNGAVELDRTAATARVHAGARWSQVIAALDPLGFGPRVMQSNNDFGVAATFCVNAHGWPVREGPMGATVNRFDMVLPDGDLVTCSRNENSELFAMTMGGYGLTGAITAMEISVAPNLRLEPAFERLPAKDFGPRFVAALADDQVNMAYGRLNVDRANFLEDAHLITYRPTAIQSDLPPASSSGALSHVARYVYRAQLGNEAAKRRRWWFEATLAPRIAGGAVTRNSLINEPVVTLDDRDPDRTDILHEYFVSPERFAEFVALCRAVIPASYQEFLNVTLRWVEPDMFSWLTYSPVPRIAAVMSFSQEMTRRAEADMLRMTRALIDGVIQLGGTYYLPYRPHATMDQFIRAYPGAERFAAAKRVLDPDGIFRSAFWTRYLEPF